MIGRTWHGYMSVEPIGAGRIVAGLAFFRQPSEESEGRRTVG